MKSLSRIAIATMAAGLIGSVAFASKPPKCHACHMVLSKTKDKVHTVAVKTKNGTMYCCAGCKMNMKSKPKSK